MAHASSGRPPRAASPDLDGLFDEASGTISSSIYADPALYALELERIFARSWLVVAHESHIAKPGDFMTSYMAEDPVIVARQKDGQVKVLLNQCRHRGMKLCRTDFGHARGFMCSYHGWAYDLAGNLVNVPLEEGSFQGIDKSRWGARAARVETYKGLVFATWNEAAPPLKTYLGDIAFYLDALLDRSEGGTEAIGGIVKWVIPCNWKFAAEQFASDMYHGLVSHASPQMAVAALNEGPPGEDPMTWPTRQFRAARGGHGTGFFVTPTQWGYRIAHAAQHVPGFDPRAAMARVEAHMGDRRAHAAYQHITVFPNFSIYGGVDTARIWHPRGPDEIEIWSFGLVDKAASPEEKEQARLSVLRTFSPAGTWEQDDGENWVEIQRVLRGREARKTVLNAQMGMALPAGDDAEFPGAIGTAYAEEAARGFYAHWLAMMRDDGEAAPASEGPASQGLAHAAE